MPIRTFVSQSIPQLQATLGLLEKAMQFGNLSELRVAGIMGTSGRMTQGDLTLRYNQCRYELYLRAQAVDPNDPNKATLVAQYTNPYIEKGMKVSSRSAVGVFGYPIPAPLAPPEP